MGAFISNKTRTITLTPEEYPGLEREETVELREGLTMREVETSRKLAGGEDMLMIDKLLVILIVSWSFEDEMGKTAEISEENVQRLSIDIYQALVREVHTRLPLGANTSRELVTAAQ